MDWQWRNTQRHVRSASTVVPTAPSTSPPIPAVIRAMQAMYNGGQTETGRPTTGGGIVPLSAEEGHEHLRNMSESTHGTETGPADWDRRLLVWLHDPIDKALNIRGYEARAARYTCRALGRPLTREELRIRASLPEYIAKHVEAIPMPTIGDAGERAVALQDGRLEVRHPVSAQREVLNGLRLDEERVQQIIGGIVSALPDDPRARFLALWRLLPDRIERELGTAWARLPADARVPDHGLIQHADITTGICASEEVGHGSAYLSFSLGPIQTFIAAARSVRDLWSGSAILSWLTFQGIRPVVATLGPTALVYPALRGNPLMDVWLRKQAGLEGVVPLPSVEARRAPSIPNNFVALVPWGPDGDHAATLAATCTQAVHAAWQRLAEQVRTQLDRKLSSLDPGWAHRWQDQVDSFFDVRTAVLPTRDLNDTTLARLIGGVDSFADVWTEAAKVRGLADAIPPHEHPGHDQHTAGRWQARLEVSARLMEAQRTIRHVPASPRTAPDETSPPKCSLLGSYEQMGPAGLEDSRRFWTAAADVQVHGVRLRDRERLCAIALSKRFAAPAYLAAELDLQPADLRFPDTSTVAAAHWLREAGIDPADVRREHGDWNGRWLHRGDDPPPQPVKERISHARKCAGDPPAYYAILMMDADNMSGWLRGDHAPSVQEVLHPQMVHYYQRRGAAATDGLQAKRPVGPALHAAISAALSNFASHIAPTIVNDHEGTTIYSGGDDVLALLPARRAVACAEALRLAFRDEGGDLRYPAMGDRATLSAGVAFVHCMEDLRVALDAARHAEQAAKNGGRDRLTLHFMRRSGERSEASLPWEFAAWFQNMVAIFSGGATDHWTYRLRAELPTLAGAAIPGAAVRAELRRLVDRTSETSAPGSSAPRGAEVDRWWQRFTAADQHRDSPPGELLTSFTLLCQGASFVARGNDG